MVEGNEMVKGILSREHIHLPQESINNRMLKKKVRLKGRLVMYDALFVRVVIEYGDVISSRSFLISSGPRTLS